MTALMHRRWLMSLVTGFFVLVLSFQAVFAGNISLGGIWFDSANLIVTHTADSAGTYVFEFCLSPGGCYYPTITFTGPGTASLPWGGIPENPNTTYTVRARDQNGGAWSNTVSCTMNASVTSCGGSEPPPPPSDRDGDGVPDSGDACPDEGNLGYGLQPNGCPIRDSDGDGIPDPSDSCPSEGYVGGFSVLPNGCQPDSDSDGVKDYQDACPVQGSMGYGLDGRGCPVSAPSQPNDRDGDGVTDNVDACPDTGNLGYGLQPNGCSNPTPGPGTPTAPIFRTTPDPNSPCNLVASVNNVYVRHIPSIVDNTPDRSLSASDGPFTVIGEYQTYDGFTWFLIQIGEDQLWVSASYVTQGGTNCDNLPAVTPNLETPVETPVGIATPELDLLPLSTPLPPVSEQQIRDLLTLAGCSTEDNFNFVRDVLPRPVQYSLLANPQEACFIINLTNGDSFGLNVRADLLSGIEQAYTLCPVEAAQYVQVLGNLYNLNPSEARDIASEVNGQPNAELLCGAINDILRGNGGGGENSSSEINLPRLVTSCLPNAAPERIQTVINYLNSPPAKEISQTNPCETINTINIYPIYTPEVDELIGRCGNLAFAEAVMRLLVRTAGYAFAPEDRCFEYPIGLPQMPVNPPSAIAQCPPEHVNIWLALRNPANREWAGYPSDQVEAMIFNGSNPCSALRDYLVRGAVMWRFESPLTPAVPSQTPILSEQPTAAPPAALPSTITDAYDALILDSLRSRERITLVVEGELNGVYALYQVVEGGVQTPVEIGENVTSPHNMAVNDEGRLAYVAEQDGEWGIFYQFSEGRPIKLSLENNLELSLVVDASSTLAWGDDLILYATAYAEQEIPVIVRIDVKQLDTPNFVELDLVARGATNPVVSPDNVYLILSYDNRLRVVETSQVAQEETGYWSRESELPELLGLPTDGSCTQTAFSMPRITEPFNYRLAVLCGDKLYLYLPRGLAPNLPDESAQAPKTIVLVENYSNLTASPVSDSIYMYDNNRTAFSFDASTESPESEQITLPVGLGNIGRLYWTTTLVDR